jgi:hypothetical protein
MNEQQRLLRHALRQGMSDLARQDQYGMLETPTASGASYPLPQIELETRQSNLPRVGGSISTPFAGGEFGLSGSYYQPAPAAPADWSTMLRYQRKF